MEEGQPIGGAQTGADSGLHAELVRSTVAARLFVGAARVAPPRVGRFRLERRLGAGGMGEVFQALAEDTGQRLALKMLHAHGARALERLKLEFRAISGVVHPNLVRLYELHLEHDLPFLTMELVAGGRLLEHVRPAGQPDPERLRQWLLQMADALDAIHAVGQLHHDIKPSNLRVRENGELVVLDFGLVRAIGSAAGGPSSGTPIYMAPERLAGGAVDQASDWYSAGVVLYEALSGRLPYEPASGVIDRRELRPEPLPVTLPADLRGLCMRLLRRDPRSRPGAFEIRAALGAKIKAPVATSAAQRNVFVGRGAELAKMREAFETARRGRLAAVYVEGEPGIGKSALVAEFLAGLQSRGGVSVLRSRCHPREFIAYNAVDGLVDCLASEIQRCSDHEQREICRDISQDAGQLFPVLRTLPFAMEQRAPADGQEPQELRRRAFAGLRLLLQRCADRRPLVLHVDDLQWADADSASLLLEVLRPGPHPMLFVGSFRAADAPHSTCIQALRASYSAHGPDSTGVPAREIFLGPLSHDESSVLARALAGDTLSSACVESVTRDAGGSPLFMRALLQHGVAETAADSLHALLRNVLRGLAASARELLEIVAISDRPISRALMMSAVSAREVSDRVADDLLLLEQLALVRVISDAGDLLFECYHDRIREIVSAETHDRVARHARLAEAAAGVPDPDLEFVAYQYVEARELTRAAQFAERAGDRAHEALALEHAAKLYGLALECVQPERPLSLLEKRARALAAAGHCGDAAPLYLEAGERWNGEESVRMQLCAAEMYLRSGQLRRCAEVARPALQAVGVRYPESQVGALISAMTSLSRLWFRDLRAIRPRRPPTDLEELRTEACFRLGCVLGIVVPPLGAALILKSVEHALECGSDAQLGRALASYAWMMTILGIPATHRKRLLLQKASDIADHSDDSEVRAWVSYVNAINANVHGDFEASLDWLQAIRRQLVAHGVDTIWLRSDCESGYTTNLLLLGRMVELNTVCLERIERARHQGNRLHFADARAQMTFALCARADARSAIGLLDESLDDWASEPFCQAPAVSIWAKLNCLLYLGEAHAACEVAREYRPAFQRAGYMRTALWGTGMQFTFGSVALACAFHDRDSRIVREVRRAARVLRRYRTTWAAPASTLLQAGLARYRDDVPRAVALYGHAAAGFDACGLHGHAAAARARLAEIVPPAEAARVRAAADAWFAAEAIVEPDNWTRMYAPGPEPAR